MSNQRKLEANRANAQRSTGPKSSDGKSKSSRNAIKTGVYSINTIIFGEDVKLHEAIKCEQQKRFPSKSYVDEALVDQLVAELWRLRRISKAEYLLGAKIQEDLGKIDPKILTKQQAKLFERVSKNPVAVSSKLSVQQVRLDGYEIDQGEEDLDNELLQNYRRLEEKVTRIDSVYMDMFLSSSFDSMQKIISLKRQALQTILSLERELERRKSKSASGDLRNNAAG